MRRAERLFRLVDELRARPVTRATDLSERLEVSVRTIYRDVAHLQASGLPIEGEAGVGYLLRPGFNLPSVTFTHDQIDALAVGLAYVEQTGDPALAAAAREARAKIQAGLPEPEERRLTDAPYLSLISGQDDGDIAARIRMAIRDRTIIDIAYRDVAGVSSRRRVCPLVVWDILGGRMFSGWCELREGFRTFRLDRIEGLVETDETFSDDPERGLEAFLAQEDCRA